MPIREGAVLALFWLALAGCAGESTPTPPGDEIAARAATIDALQRGRTGKHDERQIRALFLQTRGEELTRLKNLIDAGGDHHDLHQLIYHDLDDEAIRRELLDHFAAEAVPTGQLKVLSDIDDTLYANWKDERFPGDTVYPGVVTFYRELDRGPDEPPDRVGDLVFVSARPGERSGRVEKITHESLRRRGIEHATVLTGGLTALVGHERIAERKLENFEHYRRLFPEYAYVLVGDSGQGDAILGAEVRSRHPELVRAVFIHDVVATPEAERIAQRERDVYFFDTYVGAGIEAHRLGLIGDAGLARVVSAALGQFDTLEFDSVGQRSRRWEQLRADVDRANESLPPGDRVPRRM